MLECGAAKYASEIPLILKCNSSNSLATEKDQAVTGTVADALRLGCAGIGFTIYPGSEYCFDQMEEFRELAAEAKAAGLAVILWSYPRGPMLDKPAETAVDVCAYAAHMAALCGAHIIKVKPPTDLVALPANKAAYEQNKIDISTLPARIQHVVQSSFAGRRIVIFSGGEKAGTDNLLTTIKGIHDGGGFGSIIGRNVFQRPKAEALDLLNQIITIFKS